MIYQEATYEETQNRKRGLYATIFFHVIAILLLLLPFFKYDYPPKESFGILVALGFEESGANDNASSQQDELTEEVTDNQTSNENDQKISTAAERSVENTKVKSQPQQTETQVETTDDNSEVIIAANKAKEEAAEAEKLAEKKRQQADAIARENAQKKADAEAKKKAEYEKSKQQYGDLLGKGKGNNNTTGNQGSTTGDPNSDVLETLAKGSGRIGGGLSSRGVVSEPRIQDSSNKVGKIVINVCVDSNGKVTEAKFTQRGSTTTDAHLVDVARRGALKYKFSPAEVESQCGTVTVDFRVK